MKNKSLLTSNPYIKDDNLREKLLRRVVLTSSAVEGVHKAAIAGLSKKDKAFPVTSPGVSAAEQQ